MFLYIVQLVWSEPLLKHQYKVPSLLGCWKFQHVLVSNCFVSLKYKELLLLVLVVKVVILSPQCLLRMMYFLPIHLTIDLIPIINLPSVD